MRKQAGATDTITDFSPDLAAEKILFVGFDSIQDFTQISASQVGSDVHLDLSDEQSVVLKDLNLTQIE